MFDMGTPCNWSCQGEFSHIVEFDSILPEICVGWVVGWVFYRCFSSKFKTVKELRHKRSQDLWAFISWLHFHEDVDELAIEPVSPSPVSASVEVGESGVDGPMVEASVVRSQRMENQQPGKRGSRSFRTHGAGSHEKGAEKRKL